MRQRTVRVSGLAGWQITLIFMLAAFLSGVTASRAAAQGGAPVLVIPAPHYDAGTVWEGEALSHDFEVKNQGTAELRILQVRPG